VQPVLSWVSGQIAWEERKGEGSPKCSLYTVRRPGSQPRVRVCSYQSVDPHILGAAVSSPSHSKDKDTPFPNPGAQS
jgi:hypothetical protein